MNTILVMGYSNFELGIFDEKDPRILVIKKAVKRHFSHCLENNLKWIIFTGSLGFEYWALQVAKDLQKEYAFQIGTLFDFENHGQNWNEANQQKLLEFKNVDFVKYAYEQYENPGQFREYNQFLLENTDGSFVFYDEEKESKLKYQIKKMKNMPDYELNFLDFETLQEIYEEMNEE